jgi:ADP-ribose pyrophosphatase YjhB (NUDIX family)
MSPEDKFCPGCASELVVRDVHGHQRPVCPNCRRIIYYDPKVAVTSVVQRDGKVLLVRRASDPGYGLWSMPGGYVDRGEVVEEAAAREVQEETGLEVAIDGLIGLFSQAGQPVIVAAFYARETGGALSAGDEALDVGFFSLDELPALAFPGDRRIIARWLGSAGDNWSAPG